MKVTQSWKVLTSNLQILEVPGKLFGSPNFSHTVEYKPLSSIILQSKWKCVILIQLWFVDTTKSLVFVSIVLFLNLLQHSTVMNNNNNNMLWCSEKMTMYLLFIVYLIKQKPRILQNSAIRMLLCTWCVYNTCAVLTG